MIWYCVNICGKRTKKMASSRTSISRLLFLTSGWTLLMFLEPLKQTRADRKSANDEGEIINRPVVAQFKTSPDCLLFRVNPSSWSGNIVNQTDAPFSAASSSALRVFCGASCLIRAALSSSSFVLLFLMAYCADLTRASTSGAVTSIKGVYSRSASWQGSPRPRPLRRTGSARMSLCETDFDDNNNSHNDIDDYDNKDNHLQITFTYPITVSKEPWQRKNTCQFWQIFLIFIYVYYVLFWLCKRLVYITTELKGTQN